MIQLINPPTTVTITMDRIAKFKMSGVKESPFPTISSIIYHLQLAKYCIKVYNYIYSSVMVIFMKDFRSYCEMFYAAHYLPIALYQDGSFLCSSGYHEEGDPYPFALPKLMAMGGPAVYVSSDTGYYGLVNCGDGLHCFVLGPAYATPVTDEFILSYMSKNAISPDRYGEIASYLGGIPQYTYNQFLNLLLYLHFTLTGEKLAITDAFGLNPTEFLAIVGQQHSEVSFQAREEGIQHGTYHFEQQMLELIKNGEPEKLNAFLLAAANTANVREGKLAETPLRQAKNLFIGLVTMIGKYAAIPGGLDIEQTYQLIDTYIQECEKLQTEEAVKNLQYNMPMDFARRVAQQKLPEGVSQEIFTCMQFIATHINEPISTSDVVTYSEKSRAYLFKKFKEELGTSIAAYIMECRLREAKSLLRYTDKPLAEISSYLCFSSQSHFQSVFKKQIGVTPLEYRRLQKNK